jgi:hypothetical protein
MAPLHRRGTARTKKPEKRKSPDWPGSFFEINSVDDAVQSPS